MLGPRIVWTGSPAHAGIDPGRASLRTACWRLPRTRGDRPQVDLTPKSTSEAPPHTRGSTRGRSTGWRHPLGSPAHAGIDPDPRASPCRRSGLPRTRGDRPRSAITHLPSLRAPPHTRGSTHHADVPGRVEPGSPAHAGIDPCCSAATAGSRRLPRTRGDRPQSVVLEDALAVAPPHTRGSTPHPRRAEEGPAGSPAHAGIDPRQGARSLRCRGLPRTRGDRPEIRSAIASTASAPPHTRGSTHRAEHRRQHEDGSPAHAGIDPRRRARPCDGTRLPRTRGDRPSCAPRQSCARRAPPHTRGSTHRQGHGGRSFVGSPAHAGIDPPRGRSLRADRGLPRTRGDRPSDPCARRSKRRAPPHTRGSTHLPRLRDGLDEGSPAHAGIDPPPTASRAASSRLPRTRGDRPPARSWPAAFSQAPPHTRGSTRVRRLRSNEPGGSPAHAGIDPRALDRVASPSRLPRTRGDRPRQEWRGIGSVLAPPHTRGSTHDGQPRQALPHGSPAHAGIDPGRPRRRGRRSRLPRTRGDRPRDDETPRPAAVAPPHTRGSTRRELGRAGAVVGSPAHAGIDPSSTRVRRSRTWLPRTRGDRPTTDPAVTLAVGAPPHTRGSTPARSEGRRGAAGSPAHAGIDPLASPLAELRPGLPRTRGDRPAFAAPARLSQSAPPHTRGSTRPTFSRRRPSPGSPAHAGIDPRGRLLSPAAVGLPRTRGDRPVADAVDEALDTAPPHTRGSTLQPLEERGEAPGSPAHAGIDPARRSPGRARRRLPRTRGDRPRVHNPIRRARMAPPHTRGSTPAHAAHQREEGGSPAHAGIDPPALSSARPTCGLPRTRGDRPSGAHRSPRSAPAPPHTRGSTRDADIPRGADAGSPAHAGIDPRRRRPSSVPSRLPRTRGDRPRPDHSFGRPCLAPPHTRGSTRPRPGHRRSVRGSPAHAGIDP